jgi:hypothetical protein
MRIYVVAEVKTALMKQNDCELLPAPAHWNSEQKNLNSAGRFGASLFYGFMVFELVLYFLVGHKESFMLMGPIAFFTMGTAILLFSHIGSIDGRESWYISLPFSNALYLALERELGPALRAAGHSFDTSSAESNYHHEGTDLPMGLSLRFSAREPSRHYPVKGPQGQPDDIDIRVEFALRRTPKHNFKYFRMEMENIRSENLGLAMKLQGEIYHVLLKLKYESYGNKNDGMPEPHQLT